MKMTKCIPYLPVYNIQQAVDFYRSKFGFAVPFHDKGFAKLIRDEAEIHLWTAGDEEWKTRSNFSHKPILSGAESFLPGTAGCRIEIQAVDELFAEYKHSQVLYSADTIVEVTPWKTKEFPTLDLHGNLLTFFERIGPKPGETV